MIILKDPKAQMAEMINMNDFSNGYVSFDLPEVATGHRDFAHDLVLLQSQSETEFFAYYDSKFLLRMSYNQTRNLFVVAERIPLPDHLDLILKRSFDVYQKIFSSKHILIKDGILQLLARNACGPAAEDSKDDTMALSMVSVELTYPYEFKCSPLSSIMEQNQRNTDNKEEVSFMQA